MAAEGNVGLAFALVIIAGLCTTIGSTFAFCTNLANHALLAGALGVSAGVMIYVSFAEIFCVKAVEGFEQGGYSNAAANRYATLCFFSGVMLTVLLDKAVHWLTHVSGQAPPHCSETLPAGPGPSKEKEMVSAEANAVAAPQAPLADECGGHACTNSAPTAADEDEAARLKRMGMMTALAIAIHNFPEGLATFVAALADEKMGIAIAIAIALHNIPEGVCVSMPVYYATGSKWQGFWWSFLSGISEPIGGLLGYLVLYGNNMSEVCYGALFGVVAGMMVYISLVELIPTALRYDPENKYATGSCFIGMAVMAASLLMFQV